MAAAHAAAHPALPVVCFWHLLPSNPLLSCHPAARSYIFAFYMFGQSMFKEDFTPEVGAVPKRCALPGMRVDVSAWMLAGAAAGKAAASCAVRSLAGALSSLTVLSYL